MGWIKNIIDRTKTLLLGYDAVKQGTSRRRIHISSEPEDSILNSGGRQSVLSQGRDAIRNFTLAGFVVRKHLQSVAWYEFRAKTGIAWLDDELKRRVEKWQRPQFCDITGRRSFAELIYLIELLRVVDGDVFILLLRNNRLQVIEGDRVRSSGVGTDLSGPEWVQGVKVNKAGKPIAYAICDRGQYGGFTLNRIVNSDNCKMLGYYQRADQIRGVSLLTPALRAISYLYDGLDLALAKLKLEQILGLKTMTDDTSGIGYSEDEDREGDIHKRAVEKLGPGILHLELRQGEDAAFMESNNPSRNYQDFVEQTTRLIFAALDIPYSFYDGSKTNYYGSEGEFEQYIDSVERKQQATINLLDDIFVNWLVPNWLTDPDDPLFLPPGVSPADLYGRAGWHGAGLPAWRMLRRVKELLVAVQAGFLPASEAVGDYGYDLASNLEELAKIKNRAEELGLSLPIFSGRDANINVGV